MTTVVHQGLTPSRSILSNGVVVIGKQTRTTPAVTISATFRAGSMYDPPSRLGLANFVSRTIDRGTTARSADQIAEALDGRGVSLIVLVTRHQLGVTCTCLSDDFDRMLDLVGDICVHPTFPDDEVETRRKEIVTSIRQDEDNPAVMAVESLMALLYPHGHPYGRLGKGTNGGQLRPRRQQEATTAPRVPPGTGPAIRRTGTRGGSPPGAPRSG